MRKVYLSPWIEMPGYYNNPEHKRYVRYPVPNNQKVMLDGQLVNLGGFAIYWEPEVGEYTNGLWIKEDQRWLDGSHHNKDLEVVKSMTDEWLIKNNKFLKVGDEEI